MGLAFDPSPIEAEDDGYEDEAEVGEDYDYGGGGGSLKQKLIAASLSFVCAFVGAGLGTYLFSPTIPAQETKIVKQSRPAVPVGISTGTLDVVLSTPLQYLDADNEFYCFTASLRSGASDPIEVKDSDFEAKSGGKKAKLAPAFNPMSIPKTVSVPKGATMPIMTCFEGKLSPDGVDISFKGEKAHVDSPVGV